MVGPGLKNKQTNNIFSFPCSSLCHLIGICVVDYLLADDLFSTMVSPVMLLFFLTTGLLDISVLISRPPLPKVKLELVNLSLVYFRQKLDGKNFKIE
jgi:hypothetical protein